MAELILAPRRVLVGILCLALIASPLATHSGVGVVAASRSRRRRRSEQKQQQQQQQQQQSGTGSPTSCAFSPEAQEQIRRWALAPEGEEVPLNAELLQCYARDTGKAVGAAAGLVGGAWFGNAVGDMIFGEGKDSGGTARSLLVGGLAVVGGLVGHVAGDSLATTAMSFFLNRPRSHIEQDCMERFGVDETATPRQIKAAYRRLGECCAEPGVTALCGASVRPGTDLTARVNGLLQRCNTTPTNKAAATTRW